MFSEFVPFPGITDGLSGFPPVSPAVSREGNVSEKKVWRWKRWREAEPFPALCSDLWDQHLGLRAEHKNWIYSQPPRWWLLNRAGFMVLQAGPIPGAPRGAGCGCRSCWLLQQGWFCSICEPPSASLQAQPLTELQFCLSASTLRELPTPQGLCLPHSVSTKHSWDCPLSGYSRIKREKPFPLKPTPPPAKHLLFKTTISQL